MAEPDSPPPGASEAQLRALLEELYAAQLSAVAELVEVTGEEGELEVELRAHRGLFIEGRLLDRDDELVDGDYIVAIHEDSELIFDAEAYFGTFRLGPLLPGVYVLHARTYHGPLGDPVRASAGEKDLVIRVPHRVFVGGRLIDAVTREGLDGEVWFTPNADPYSAVESDAHRGIFHAGMAEGTYDVVGVSKDGKYGLRRGVSLTSDSEAESLIIEAHPGAELLVELVTSDVLGFTIHLDGALVAWRLDSKAHCTVPPGELVVRGWRFDEVIEERTVTLTVGEKKEVRFE